MMEKITLDLKTLASIFVFATVLGGFYYTTEYRLDNLQLQVKAYRTENIDLRNRISQIEKQINRLKKKISNISEK